MHPLLELCGFRDGAPCGVTSVCSAHPIVIEAALRLAGELDRPVLIEATCNQVNQEGGYTGMTPAAFRAFVERIAVDRAGYDPTRIVFGGDHLGPNPWRHLSADEAMARAEAMTAAFAEAGFTKLHLDASMGCAGEPAALPDERTAERAARLAAVAEARAVGPLRPVYVIGTEVPVPGGSVEALDAVAVTVPEGPLLTYEAHRVTFEALGLGDAFARVVALVVQPGVEFGHADVVPYDPEKAAGLTAALARLPGIVFEAHSTDFQSEQALAALVRDGFAILKVGPWLTFALREALYGLDAVADVVEGGVPRGRLMARMEEVMLADPGHWRGHYRGEGVEGWVQRHFSLSDRIRYYWPAERARKAVEALVKRLEGKAIPAPVAAQYLAGIEPGGPALDVRGVMLGAVEDVLRKYERAVGG
jgi:D-tagatose 6-phosphate 4-epimerase